MLYKKGKIYKIVTGESDDCYVGSTFRTLYKRMYSHKSAYKQWKNGNGAFISSFQLFEKFGVDNCKIILIKEYDIIIDEDDRRNERRHLEIYETLWIYKSRSINTCAPVNFLKKQQQQLYREINKDALKQKKKEYYENNKDEIKERSKKYREINNDILKQKKKEYYENNKDEIKEHVKEYSEKNKDKIKERGKKYREVNNDVIKQKKKEYSEKNKDKIKEYGKKYREENKNRINERDLKYYYENKQKILNKMAEKVLCDVCNCYVRRNDMARHKKTNKHKNNL
jgi:hypothetical protein